MGYQTYLAQAKMHSYAVVWTEEEWLAAQNPEPVTDKRTFWTEFAGIRDGHEHAHTFRDSEMRAKVKPLVNQGMSAEAILARLNKLAAEGAAQSGKDVAPIVYRLEQVQAWMTPKTNAGKGVGEPMPGYSEAVTEHAHADRAGDRAKRKARRDAKFADRDREAVEAKVAAEREGRKHAHTATPRRRRGEQQ